MNARIKENCVENDDSAKLPVTGHYTNFILSGSLWRRRFTLPLVTRMFGKGHPRLPRTGRRLATARLQQNLHRDAHVVSGAGSLRDSVDWAMKRH